MKQQRPSWVGGASVERLIAQNPEVALLMTSQRHWIIDVTAFRMELMGNPGSPFKLNSPWQRTLGSYLAPESWMSGWRVSRYFHSQMSAVGVGCVLSLLPIPL